MSRADPDQTRTGETEAITRAALRLEKQLGAPIWAQLDDWARSCLVTSELLNETLEQVHVIRHERDQFGGSGAAGPAPLVDFSPVLLEVFKSLEIQMVKALLRPFRESFIADSHGDRLRSYSPSLFESQQLLQYLLGPKPTPTSFTLDTLLRLIGASASSVSSDQLLALLRRWLKQHCPLIHRMWGSDGIAIQLLQLVPERNKAAHTHRFTPNEASGVYASLWGRPNGSGIVVRFFKAIQRAAFDGDLIGACRVTRRVLARTRFMMAEARDESTARPVVLTLFRGTLRDLELQKRELENRRAIVHQNLLPVREWFAPPPPHAGNVAIMMDGTGARWALERKRSHQSLSEADSLHLALDLAAAAAALHNRGVVHGFISPLFVFRRGDNRWLLGGHAFGALASRGLFASVYPRTVPPEIERRGVQFSIRSATTIGDVFSIAATVCCMRAGTAKRNAPPPSPDDVPRLFKSSVLVDALSKALALDPRHRHPDAGAMLAVLGGGPRTSQAALTNQASSPASVGGPLVGSPTTTARRGLSMPSDPGTDAVFHSQRVDVLIVTAVKEEYEEALKVDEGALGHWDKKPGPTGLEVAFRAYSTTGNGPLHVALTRALEMRGVAAANAAWPLISRYEPRCLAMCGACAGRRGETNLGDVLVGEILFTYDTGAVVVEYDEAGARHERYKGEPSPYRIPAVWRQKAESFAMPSDRHWLVARPLCLELQGHWLLQQLVLGADPVKHPERTTRCPSWQKVIERLRKQKLVTAKGLALTDRGRVRIEDVQLLNPDGLGPPPPFKVRVAPIATGNSVVRDPRIFERLESSMRKVLGVEMEAAAIGAIAHVQDIKWVLVMKGVMDHADEDKEDGFKGFAARASAECLIGFLRENLPSTPDWVTRR